MLVQQVEVSIQKLSGSTAGRKSVFVVRPTNQTSVTQGLFLGRSRRRATAQTRPVALKMPQVLSAFYLKGRPRRLAINLTPRKKVRAWEDGPLRLEDSGQDAPDMNVSLLDSTSAWWKASAWNTATNKVLLWENICLCLSPDRTWHKVRWPEGRL